MYEIFIEFFLASSFFVWYDERLTQITACMAHGRMVQMFYERVKRVRGGSAKEQGSVMLVTQAHFCTTNVDVYCQTIAIFTKRLSASYFKWIERKWLLATDVACHKHRNELCV